MYNPVQKIHLNLIRQVITEAWPENDFDCIEDQTVMKNFYNEAYKNFESRLEKELTRFHPAGVIRVAYEQLHLWTFIFLDLNEEGKGNTGFIPYGRYGWRYVIEKSLERLHADFDFQELKPDQRDCELICTLFLGMIQTSEYSNYIHHLGDKLPSAKLEFSPQVLFKHPQLNESELNLFRQIVFSLSKSPTEEKYINFSPQSVWVQKKVSEFLKQNMNVDLDEIQLFIEKGLIGMCKEIGGEIMIQPMAEFVVLMHRQTGLTDDKIISIMRLIFYHVYNRNTEPRNFLRRSQQNRMLNYAGIVMGLGGHLHTIYDEKNAERIFQEEYLMHVIVSPAMAIDWFNAFIPRLALGQRTDLKEDETLNRELAKLESFYHKEIFEKQVMGLLEKRGFCCFNLAKLDRKPIACGEIDILAYSGARKELFIIECKALSPTVDARGIGQVISDHYGQKKYHRKFLRKIEWVNKNRDLLKPLIKQNADNEKEIVINEVRPFFITCYNDTIGLFEDNYRYMTYYEFDRFLQD